MSLLQMGEEFRRQKAEWGEKSELVKSAVLEAFCRTPITTVVCFDVGLQPSLYYFAAIMAIVDKIDTADIRYFAQKQDYTDIDTAFLHHYKYKIADYPEGIYHVDGSTLVFCVNPSAKTIDATSQGPQPAMLVIYDKSCMPETLANFDQRTLPLTGDPSTWSLYTRKASIGQHRYGIDTGIGYPKPTLFDMAPYLALSSGSLGLGFVDEIDQKFAKETILEKMKETLEQHGPNSEHTLEASKGLAELLKTQGKQKEARILLQRVLVHNMEKYGVYHIHALISLRNMCTTLEDPGVVESLLQTTLRGLEEAKGLCYDITAFTAQSLGYALFKAGKHAESEGPFEKALVYYRENVPKERRRGHSLMMGVYKTLMTAKVEVSDQMISNGNKEAGFAKLMEVEALTKEY